MQNIKNIVFDLGGVILDIDFNATQKAFEDLGFTQFHTLFTQHHANDLFEQLETGKITSEQFYTQLRVKTGLRHSNTTLCDAWNAMLLHFSKEKMQWITTLSEKYNLYLFSNTNQIHYDYFTQSFLDEIGGKPLNNYFIKAWYSHEIGIRKPYPESYTLLMQKEGLSPKETLFIDDTIGNIEGAKEAGLQTIHLEKPQSILHLDL